MRLVTIDINKEDIKKGQVRNGKPRTTSDPVFIATQRVIPEVMMVGGNSIQLEIFGIELPQEAIDWIKYADRHYQGLEKKPPKPIKFNVIHPL